MSLSLSPVLRGEGGGASYRAQANTTLDLYLVGTHARDVYPSVFFTGVICSSPASVVFCQLQAGGTIHVDCRASRGKNNMSATWWL